MELCVAGEPVHGGSGGRAFDPTLPLTVFLHCAGMDHTVWALPARYFAHRGRAVLAAALPGNGTSGAAPLKSIAAMAAWVARVLDAGPEERRGGDEWVSKC